MENRTEAIVLSTIFSGGVATCSARTATAPLERLKILFQGQKPNYKSLGILQGLKEIYFREGVRGYYRGNGAMMLRTFPYGAVQFLTFEQFKKALKPVCGNRPLNSLISGSLAGLTACSITYPLDTVRCRLAFQVAGEQLYFGIYHTLRHISSSEGGILALYRGFGPQSLAMFPTIGLGFFLFESFKELIVSLDRVLTRVNIKSGETVLTPLGGVVSGAGAGVITQTVAYPLDVVKRRMQLGGAIKNQYNYSGLINTLITVYTEDGVKKGLYRGLSINYLRVVPQVAVMFGVYELTKQLLES